MKHRWPLPCILCLFITVSYAQNTHTLSGYIRESGSKELLPGVTIYIPDLKTGTVTNTYGFYSITLPSAAYSVHISFVGYETVTQEIDLTSDKELDVELITQTTTLETIVVSAERQERISETPLMSLVKIPVSQVQDIPAFLGEKDVLKTLQLLPGVQSGSEGSSGIYVRGGGPDQNLLILDDATVYNANHLFGFFSVFNGDALKSVELYKGGFPARFGGRLSSVVDMNMKDGSRDEFKGKGGIGLISSNVTIEGPLANGKSSFLISGRRTYVDIFVRPFLPKGTDAGYYFYDLNTKLNYDFGKKNKLYLSGYFGRDRFFSRFEDTSEFLRAGLGWGNGTGTLRWNHLFNNRLFANTSLIFSNYEFKVDIREEFEDENFKLVYRSGIRDFTGKFDVDYLPNPRHSIKSGLIFTHHRFTPSALVLEADEFDEFENKEEIINTIEAAAYIEDEFKPANNVVINAGIRFSAFNHEDVTYFRPEPRISAAWKIGPELSVKSSYAIMNQYIHLLSNSGIGLPTDLWVPSTDRVKPQTSQQVALGLAKDLPKLNLTATLEGYYKSSEDVISYKEGADFLLLDELESAEELDFQNNITTGEGKAYGIEFLLQRKFGKMSGWIGYTLSWTKLRFDSLNFGKEFFARYDRRHDLSVVGIYKPNKNITLSGTFIYGTGQALTLPVANYSAPGHDVTGRGRYQFGNFGGTVDGYQERGNFRAEPYHRLDLGIQFHKARKKGMRTWEISVYNAYNRKNPFFYITEVDTENFTASNKVLKRITVFPFIPSISYKFEF